jgi:signal transduction histidine kinase
MRALLFELQGGDDEDELLPLLKKNASELRAREGLAVEVQGPDSSVPLSSEAQAHLFAIGREALSNVAKHSAARRAWIRLETEPSRISMEIRDDGIGFETADRHPGHYGLESMRSRAAELGGTLTIRSGPAVGTVVRVDVPMTHVETVDDA